MAERFYLNLPLTPGPVELIGPEAHHLAQVSRLAAGDAVCLFNGDGREYAGRVESVRRRSVMIQIEAVREPQRELPFHLEIAAPVPKGDRAQSLIEKLTELGVTAFVPLLCERTVIHAGQGKLDKLERYVIEASKQCGRNRLLRIEPPLAWDAFLERRQAEEWGWIAHPAGSAPALSAPKPHAIRGAVGPEGGFSAAEIERGVAAGWSLVSLGPRILRIETAALVLAAWAST
jgi:16S rRNA (uracil1498-N3)-methyltransferase